MEEGIWIVIMEHIEVDTVQTKQVERL